MNIQLYKALWGMEGSCRDQLTRAAQAGYAGIEAPLPPANREAEFKDLLEEFQLHYIAQVTTSVPIKKPLPSRRAGPQPSVRS